MDVKDRIGVIDEGRDGRGREVVGLQEAITRWRAEMEGET
jgi:hypothetical protein